jgi:integrase
MTPSLPARAGVPATISPRVHRYADNAKSVNTCKAYRIDWDDFTSWCQVQGCQPMPTAPESITDYQVSMADAGSKVATIQRRLASLSVVHQVRGYEDTNPDHSGLVTTTMQGIRHTLGTAELTRLVAACEQMEPQMAARNRALLLIGVAGGFRRSELVALDVADIAETKEGLELTIRRSKTDQEGAGSVVPVPYGSHPQTCPVRALRAWLALAAITEGPLWREIDRHGNVGTARLHAHSVGGIIKRTCTPAGLDP